MGKRFEVKRLLPKKLLVCLGDKARLNLKLGIWPLPNICWEVSRDGGCTWKVILENEECLIFKPRFRDSGNLYRAIITTKCEYVITNETKLIIGFIDLVQNPSSICFRVGELATFTVGVEGIPKPQFQWQVSENGGLTWLNLVGETSAILSFIMEDGQQNFLYRAIIQNNCGKIISDFAVLITLYSANGAGGSTIPVPPADLMILDSRNGNLLKTVGNTGFSVTGLAISPITGKMFGVTSRNDPNKRRRLIEINPQTGRGTVIGSFRNPDVNGIPDITFRSDGTLFGWAEFDDNLVTINTSNGDATVIADSGLSTFGTGLTFTPNGNLYVYGVFGINLQQIDPVTGLPVGLLISTTKFSGGAMTANSNNLLYAITQEKAGGPSGPRFLTTVDPITGTTNILGSVPLRTDALVFC